MSACPQDFQLAEIYFIFSLDSLSISHWNVVRIHRTLLIISKRYFRRAKSCTISKRSINGMTRSLTRTHGQRDQVSSLLATIFQRSSKSFLVSLAGSKFILTFHFSPREIVVYEDECKNYQYSFSHKFDMGDIRAVQVWDDVEYIDEITFRYKNTADNEIWRDSLS